MWRFGKLLPCVSILSDKENPWMNIPIDLVVYPLKDGANLSTRGRVVGLSPITPTSGLIILLEDGISLRLGDEMTYDTEVEQYCGHAYIWCERHITLRELDAAFAKTKFKISCTPHPKANSPSHPD